MNNHELDISSTYKPMATLSTSRCMHCFCMCQTELCIPLQSMSLSRTRPRGTRPGRGPSARTRGTRHLGQDSGDSAPRTREHLAGPRRTTRHATSSHHDITPWLIRPCSSMAPPPTLPDSALAYISNKPSDSGARGGPLWQQPTTGALPPTSSPQLEVPTCQLLSSFATSCTSQL